MLLFTDTILGIYDRFEQFQNLFRKKKEVSLIGANIYWCTRSEWMDRLIAYKQLELWTFDK